MLRKFLFIALLLGLSVAPTRAQLPTNQLATLFGTGLSETSTSLANGDTDTHWTLVSSPSGSGYGTSLVVMPDTVYPISTAQWLDYGAGNGATRWLVPNYTTPGSTTHAVGNYTLRTTFNLPVGLTLSDVRLFFRGAADNSVTDVLLNGTSTGTAFSGFASWSSITTLSSGFVSGTNTLDFIVNNSAGATANPMGLRVELSALIPEPSSVALFLLGTVGLSMIRRRQS